MHIIGIDVGASFLKCARISGETGAIEDLVVVSSEELLGQKDNRILGILETVKQLIHRFSEGEETVEIAFSTEMHGFVLADEEGNPWTDYISWQKEYGRESKNGTTYLDIVGSLIPQQRLTETGMPLRAGLPSVNLYYLLHGCDFYFIKEDLYFYTMGDFLIRHLTGKQPYIHPTNAAATGLYNLKSESWDLEIIKSLGLESVIFPRIGNRDNAIVVEDGSRKYVFYPAVGDQQAALLGSGFFKTNQVSLNFGTGAQVSLLSEKAEFSSGYQTRPYFYGQYLKTIPHIPSGRAVNVYFRFVKDILSGFVDVPDEQIWDFIQGEVSTCSSGNLEMDLSFFGNPITEHEAGSIANIGEHGLSVGNLFASIYEKMAENAEKMICRLGGNKIEEFVFSGGVARKTDYFRQAVLERFPGVKISYVAENETLKGLYHYVAAEERGALYGEVRGKSSIGYRRDVGNWQGNRQIVC